MTSNAVFLRKLFFAASFLLVCGSSKAQVGTSSITGTVLDSQGLAVVAAKIVATNEATGASYPSQTTSSGEYSISGLPPGTYTVTVTQQGFRTFNSTHNDLTVGTPLVVNVKLDVGSAKEVVQVESAYERLDTTSAMLSDVMDRRAIQNLPLNGRNPLNLITLQAGLVQRSTGGAGSGTHVNGSRDRAFNVTLDGIDINEPSVPNPQSNVFRLNTDNVQEFRVVTQNPTAEFGRNSGANIALTSRSGTKEIRGDVYEYFRNPVLNANDWFNNLQGIEKPNFKLHQYGVNMGGPFWGKKTFWFGSWQGQRLNFTESISQAFGRIPLVYTQSARNGLFRYVVGTVNGRTSNSPALVDPKTGALLPGIATCSSTVITNCIATFSVVAAGAGAAGGPFPLDPVMGQFINSPPLANNFTTGDGLNTAGFVSKPPSSQPEARWLARFDHQFNDNNSIFVRYTIAFADTKQGDFLNRRPQVFPGFPPLGEVSRRPSNLAVNYRRVFSPHLVNSFTAGYARFQFDFLFGRANPNFPNIPPFQPSNITTPFNNQSGTARWLTTVQYVDDLGYTHRNHLISVGTNIRFLQHNDQRSFVGGVNNAPAVFFSGTVRDPSAIMTLPSNISSTDKARLRNAINELLGLPSSERQAFFTSGLGGYTPSGLYVRGARAHQYNFYAQDAWKIRRNLTINAGLRWEWNRPGAEANNLILRPDRPVNSWSPTTPVTFGARDTFWDRENADAVGPRLGVAWNPFSDNNTVLRAGYAILFDPISTFQLVPILGLVPGSSAACSFSVAGNESATAATNCTLPANASAPVGRGFPLSLPPPTVPPSAFVSPSPLSSNVAPPAGAIDPNLQNPTVHEWDLALQRELPRNIVAEVGYVGKRGTHLYRAYNLNQLKINHDGFLQSFVIARNNLINCGNPVGTSSCGQPLGILQTILGSSLNSTSTTSAINTRLLNNAAGSLAALIDSNFFNKLVTATGNPSFFRPNPQFSSIFYFDSGGDSYYHGLQIHVRRHEPNFDFGVSYTFAKSIDDMSVDPVGAVSGGAVGNNSRTPTDIYNFAVDRGRSDFDRTHVVTGYAVWNLPFGRGKRWGSSVPTYLHRMIGGWTTTTILTATSGEPFSVLSGEFTNSDVRSSRADIVGPVPGTGVFQNISSITGPTVFPANALPQINPTGSPFTIPAPGSSGNQGRNIFTGPNYFNLDFGVAKQFDLTERFKLQFRADFFNLLNHANFDNPLNSTDGTPSAFTGFSVVSPSGTLPLRLQLAGNPDFGRTCCVAVSVPSSTSVIAVGEAPRVIQFALRLTF